MSNSRQSEVQSTNDIDLEEYRNRLKNSTEKDDFKYICMIDPRIARLGIEIDSARECYFLLVNDISDLAIMSEETAKYILNNENLRKNNRLRDDGFSSIVCRFYPKLIVPLFKSSNIKFPAAEDMVEVINDNPTLFKELSECQKFINLINKSEILINLAFINEEIALKIYEYSHKYTKFDKYWFTMAIGEKYENVALKILNDATYIRALDDENLLILGKRHSKAAKTIIENAKFISIKQDVKPLTTLYAKATGITYFSCGKEVINSLPKDVIHLVVNKYILAMNHHLLFSTVRESQLFDACKNFRSADVKRLLNSKISPDIKDAQGNTPLFYAAVNCDFDSVDYLCDASANVNIKNNNEQTPLIYAYENRHSEIPLQLLLSKGANPYIKSRYGSLFDLAKKENRITELGILLEWEIDNLDKVKKFKI